MIHFYTSIDFSKAMIIFNWRFEMSAFSRGECYWTKVNFSDVIDDDSDDHHHHYLHQHLLDICCDSGDCHKCFV